MDVGERILVGRDHVLRSNAQALGQRFGKRAGILGVEAIVAIGAADEGGVAPERHAVRAPVAGEGPARQRLARIPLALPEVEQAPGRERIAHARQQRTAEAALGRTHGRRVPFLAVHVVDRHERRLAAHGQAHVAGLELPIDAIAEREDVVPLFVGVRLGDPRILVHARHRHLVVELDLARTHEARHRGRRFRAGCRRERNVPFAGEQPRGRIEAHPPGAGQIYLGPGVEVREVLAGPLRALQRLLVGPQLNQITRDETRGQPEVAQRFDQQPRRVAARAAAQLQRVLARLHPGLHPDHVSHVALQPAIESDQEVDRRDRLARNRLQQRLQPRAGRLHLEKWRQLAALQLLVGEGDVLGARLEEEVERVEDGHLGDEVHLEGEDRRRFRKRDPGEEVALRILLPVDEVLRRLEAERVAGHRRTAVRRRAQPDDVR